jgi:AcrR family transcriptional regulator
MDRPRPRTARARDNDERLLDSAVAAIAETGLDRMVRTDVTERAGLTHGALYSRYDGLADLAADVWVHRAAAHVRAMIAAADRMATAAPPEAADLARFRDDPLTATAVELAVASARIPELADVVPRNLAAWIDEHGLRDRPRSLAVLAMLLGAGIYRAVDPGYGDVAPLVVRWLHQGAGATWRGAPPTSDPPDRIEYAPEDPFRDRLLQAAADVIGRSGVEGATMKRIGRTAGYSASAAYNLYRNRDDLIHDTLVRSMVFVQTRERTAPVLSTADTVAARLAGWCSTEGRVRRRLSLEVFLAALHRPSLAAAAAEIDGRAASAIAASTSRSLQPADRFQVVFRVGRGVIWGVCLLQETAGGLETVDWRPFAHPLLAGMSVEDG